jgi:hypothetical protein
VKRLLGIKNQEPVLEALKAYKKDRSDGNYARLLKTIGIVI